MTNAWSRLAERLGVEHPLVLAPMAGGPSTPALAAAVSDAGGLGHSVPRTSRRTRSAAPSRRCAGGRTGRSP